MSKPYQRLGVNIDHVATLRNARGGEHPCPIRAAKAAVEAGADGITAHLREDRRHILDADIERLQTEVRAKLNLEMALTEEMIGIALKVKPHAVCLVPEKREELTTEGGLNVSASARLIGPAVDRLSEAGIRVSLFIDPEAEQIQAAHRCGAPVVELHTGTYCEQYRADKKHELARLQQAAQMAASLGLEVHAGHGLNFENVAEVAAMAEIVELNIGHFLIGEAVFSGLAGAVKRMRELMELGRA